MKTFALFFTIICVLCGGVRSARILGIFPMAAPSHYILGNALMRGLAEAGHDVTVISPYEEKNLPKKGSYRDIVLVGVLEEYKNMLKIMNLLDSKDMSLIQRTIVFKQMSRKINEDFFSNENLQKFLKSDEKFDVVVVEQFMNDAMKIFGNIFNIPVIAFSTLGASSWVNKMVGNPSPMSYVPELQSDFSPNMCFTERIQNVLLTMFQEAVDTFSYFPQQQKILKKYFSNPPDIYDLYHNVSLVLLNSHESLNQPVPLVPNLIEIGGFHVQPPKKLPQDLQKYLDNAKEGVVYFSLGSNLRSKNLPPQKRDAILKAFGKLKEKVLWKWEDDELPGKPANVKISKWLPQQDILAHPNVKLFITHSGLLSTTETVYHGVPIMAIPVFGDQHQNAKLATASGYALYLAYQDPLFTEKFESVLQELLTNPKYKENVKKRSQLFHDRPMKPMDTAVYWVEYIIRNGGAPHLRIAGVEFPWYKYYSVDVISFITILTLLVVHLIYIAGKKVLYCWGICKKSRSKPKKE